MCQTDGIQKPLLGLYKERVLNGSCVTEGRILTVRHFSSFVSNPVRVWVVFLQLAVSFYVAIQTTPHASSAVRTPGMSFKPLHDAFFVEVVTTVWILENLRFLIEFCQTNTAFSTFRLLDVVFRHQHTLLFENDLLLVEESELVEILLTLDE